MDDLQARLEALDKAARTADCYQSAMEARRAFSVALADAYRANELVPASALAEAQAENSRLRGVIDMESRVAESTATALRAALGDAS